MATHRRPGDLVFAANVSADTCRRAQTEGFACGEDGATSPIACFSTLRHYNSNMLVALTRSPPFLIIPVIRPRDLVAMDGGNRGDTLTADGSDLSWCPYAAHRIGACDRR